MAQVLCPHPLLLQPVLEVLFTKCDFETLKNAREVCRQWWYFSFPSFNRKSTVNFYTMYPETYLELISSIEKGCHFAPEHVALTLSSSYHHEATYYNRNMTVCPWHACNECIFPYGEFIQSFKFYAWDTISDKLNATLLYQILQTPNHLRCLELSLLPEEVSTRPLFPHPWNLNPPLFYLTTLVMYGKMICSQSFMNNFLSAMPNITNITVNCSTSDFLDVFSVGLCDTRLPQLFHLKLNFVINFTESQIKNIERANLPLKTLHIAPRTWVRRFEGYTKLMQNLSKTLVDAKLTICTRVSDLAQYVVLPLMPELKVLRLQSWRGGPGVWTLNFLSSTPNLESLIMERRGLFAPIANVEQDMQCFIEDRDVPVHTKLKNLVLPSMPLLFPHRNCIGNLVSKFPNLIKLTLSANDECLECIFCHVPKLQELTIAEYSKITDDGVTGLVAGGNSKPDVVPCSNDLRLGISNLKDLKRLELDGFWGHITDFSIAHGIMHLPKLDTVILRGCKISEWGRSALANMQLTVVGHDAFHVFEPEPAEDLVM